MITKYIQFVNEGLLKGKTEDDVLSKIKDLGIVGKFKFMLKYKRKYDYDLGDIINYDGLSEKEQEIFTFLQDVQFISEPCDGVYPFREHGTWGIIDADLNIIRTEYDNIHDFYDGIAPVTLNGKWGFIDLKAELVIPIMYDNIERPSEGCIPVKFGSLWGIINSEGYEIVEIKYQFISSYHDGLCAIGNNGALGFVDTNGDIAIPLIYTDVNDFTGGLAWVKTQDGRELTINKKGEVIKEKKTSSY